MPVFLGQGCLEPSGKFAASAAASHQKRPHDDHFASKVFASDEFFGLVHTPVPIPKAFLIPEARAALEKER